MALRRGARPRAAVALLLAVLVSGCGREAGEAHPARDLAVDAGCDSGRSVCVARQGDMTVSLRLGPPVRAMHALPVRVEVRGAQPSSVTVDFFMPAMNMGRNLYALTRAQTDRWIGEVILPVCTSGRRDWLARVDVETAAGRLSAAFPFQTER
jgi:hypothetical protein